MKNEDPFDNVDDLCEAEQEARGYEEGVEAGKRQGYEKAYELGRQEGAQRGSELGYFKGYSMAQKHLAKQQEHSRQEKLLDRILQMIDDYPKDNATNCEEKLTSIRVKFKQAFGPSAGLLRETDDMEEAKGQKSERSGGGVRRETSATCQRRGQRD